MEEAARKTLYAEDPTQENKVEEPNTSGNGKNDYKDMKKEDNINDAATQRKVEFKREVRNLNIIEG